MFTTRMKKLLVFSTILLISLNFVSASSNLPTEEEINTYAKNLLANYESYIKANRIEMEENIYYNEFYKLYNDKGSFKVTAFLLNRDKKECVLLDFKRINSVELEVELEYQKDVNDYFPGYSINMDNCNLYLGDLFYFDDYGSIIRYIAFGENVSNIKGNNSMYPTSKSREFFEKHSEDLRNYKIKSIRDPVFNKNYEFIFNDTDLLNIMGYIDSQIAYNKSYTLEDLQKDMGVLEKNIEYKKMGPSQKLYNFISKTLENIYIKIILALIVLWGLITLPIAVFKKVCSWKKYFKKKLKRKEKEGNPTSGMVV